jgi:threonine dehydrogenase-like Zn-dependent dehydrogenase
MYHQATKQTGSDGPANSKAGSAGVPPSSTSEVTKSEAAAMGTGPQSPHASSISSSTAKDISNSSAVLLAGAHSCSATQGNLVVKNMPLASLTPGSVMVEIKAVGICGSDVHYHQHGRIGDFVVREPMVLGHEAAGRVVALGPGVTGLALGDRVAIEPGIGCGTCAVCKAGRYNLCADMRFLATPPVHGALCNLLVHPAHLCHKLPASVTYEEGAMCEPLSVAIYAARRSNLQLGDSVLITGAGPIGLLVAMVARAHGARRVTIMDVSLPRLRVAQEILSRGDDTLNVVHIEQGEAEAETLKKIRVANGGEMVEVAFEW